MKMYELVGREGNDATIRMSFSQETFDCRLADAYRAVMGDATDMESASLLTISALASRSGHGEEIIRVVLSGLYGTYCDEVFTALGLVPVSDPVIRPMAEGGEGEIDVEVRIVVAPEFDDISFGEHPVKYKSVGLQDGDVDDAVSRYCAMAGVASEEEYVEKTGSYASAGEMRMQISESLMRFADGMNFQNKREAAARALVEDNPIDLPDHMIAAHVDAEIRRMAVQTGQEAFDQYLAESGQTMDSLRAMIEEDAGYVPRVNALLQIIANKLDFDVTDDDRKREIAAQRSMSLDIAKAEPVAETLSRVKADRRVLAQLDRKVRLNKALDYVVERTEFVERMQMTVKECSPNLLV